MKKVNYSKVLGVLGIAIWGLTILLRERAIVTIPVIGFLLGVAPNCGAVWFFAGIFQEIYPSLFKKACTFKTTILILVGIFILGVGSEIVHDLFLNSPFDIFDIIATVVASVVYVIVAWINGKSE